MDQAVGTLRVGCPQWNHRSWNGLKPSSAWSLRSYSQFCTAVEGNTTFYALPSVASVARWRHDVPDDFRFCFKLPRAITHVAALRGRPSELRDFLIRLEPLRDRLGPTSIQLPASFGPGDLLTLRTFLIRLPKDWEWAVEVRHPAFFQDSFGPQLDELLRTADVDRITLDSRCLFAGSAETTDEIEAFRRKPRLPVRPIRTGRHPIIRFIGQNNVDANHPFWQPWLRPISAWLANGHDVYMFIHTPDNVASPLLARQFHQDVRAQVPDLAALPEPQTDDAHPALF